MTGTSDLRSKHTIVFLCLHGAAKSVPAAAYLERLADQRGSEALATAIGTA